MTALVEELVVANIPEDFRTSFCGMTSDDQIKSFWDSFGGLAKDYREMAWKLALMEENGIVIDRAKLGELRHLLLRVASGHGSPELIARYGGQHSTRLRRLIMLTIDDQNRIASGNFPKLYQKTASGTDHATKDPIDMTREEFNQVFADGFIRNEEEQLIYLSGQKPKYRQRVVKFGRVRVNMKKKQVMVGATPIRIADVVSATAMIEGDPEEDESARTKSLSIRLTEKEYRKLEEAARHAEKSPRDMIRQALRTYHLI